MQTRRFLIGREVAAPLRFLPVASDYNMSTRKRAVINTIIYLFFFVGGKSSTDGVRSYVKARATDLSALRWSERFNLFLTYSTHGFKRVGKRRFNRLPFIHCLKNTFGG